MRPSGLVACLVLASLALADGALAQPSTTSSEAVAPAPAEPPAPLPAELLAKLRQGGYLIFFRHAKTPNYADPDDSNLNNCATQRNLSKEGIAQAKALGEAFRDLEIPLGIVRASPFCRTMDTAWLAFGRFERDMSLRLKGTDPDTDPDEAKRWRNMRNMAKIKPLEGTNSIFISHWSAGAVFGAGFLDEGESVIVQPDGAGGWRLIAKVKADQWLQP